MEGKGNFPAFELAIKNTNSEGGLSEFSFKFIPTQEEIVVPAKNTAEETNLSVKTNIDFLNLQEVEQKIRQLGIIQENGHFIYHTLDSIHGSAMISLEKLMFHFDLVLDICRHIFKSSLEGEIDTIIASSKSDLVWAYLVASMYKMELNKKINVISPVKGNDISFTDECLPLIKGKKLLLICDCVTRKTNRLIALKEFVEESLDGKVFQMFLVFGHEDMKKVEFRKYSWMTILFPIKCDFWLPNDCPQCKSEKSSEIKEKTSIDVLNLGTKISKSLKGDKDTECFVEDILKILGNNRRHWVSNLRKNFEGLGIPGAGQIIEKLEVKGYIKET